MKEYLRHDFDAREDEKIIDLMAEMGWAGYGQYWGIVELLYKNNGKMRAQYNRIAFALNTHPDSIKAIIENFGLFETKNGYFFSDSVLRRLAERDDKSAKARASALNRWEHANAKRAQSERNAKKDSIGKDKKIKDKRVVFTPPTLLEVKNYCLERKNSVDAERWINHYTANGWMVGKNKMKDWQAAVRTWEDDKPKQKIDIDKLFDDDKEDS